MADEDLATGLLWEMGTRGSQILPARDGHVALLAYFDDDPGLGARLASRLSLLAGGRIEPVPIPEVDWLARVREGFRAFQLGPFRVLPAWEAPGTGSCHNLIVDPGRAFGTGDHETTRLCLQALARTATERPLGRVLDLGAGTGILAVAALRLGAEQATAVDLDTDAISSARWHATLNGAAVRVVQGDGARSFREQVFDSILANVSTRLLLERRAEILAAARPGATAILSGLLRDDVAELRAVYAPAGSVTVLTQGEWAALVISGLRRP